MPPVDERVRVLLGNIHAYETRSLSWQVILYVERGERLEAMPNLGPLVFN